MKMDSALVGGANYQQINSNLASCDGWEKSGIVTIMGLINSREKCPISHRRLKEN